MSEQISNARRSEPAKPGSLERVVRRRRMTHAEAVQAEMKRWRLNRGEDALILAFCACVGMKMKGGDMDDILSPSNAEVSDVCPPLASETEKPRTGARSLH